MSIENVIKDLGLSVQKIEHVSGGDINLAYCLQTDPKKYFLKINSASAFPRMFDKEARGLHELQITGCKLQIPAVIKHGIAGEQQYLLLEWVERGTPTKDFWEEFGTALAEMHKKHQSYFGFDEDNFIGSLHQSNKKHDSWSSFYAEERIFPLTDKLQFARKPTERFCYQLKDLFPEESPSLIHGDLWSGNFMVNFEGKACIYDPAVYYGHREMDIGMTKLFGGFDKRFYEAYNSAYPLEKGWEDRIELTQLYPLLVHAVLFGDGYKKSAYNILEKFE